MNLPQTTVFFSLEGILLKMKNKNNNNYLMVDVNSLCVGRCRNDQGKIYFLRKG